MLYHQSNETNLCQRQDAPQLFGILDSVYSDKKNFLDCIDKDSVGLCIIRIFDRKRLRRYFFIIVALLFLIIAQKI